MQLSDFSLFMNIFVFIGCPALASTSFLSRIALTSAGVKTSLPFTVQKQHGARYDAFCGREYECA